MHPPRDGHRAQDRALVITEDEALLDDLLRLGAAARIEIDVAAHPDAARGQWRSAPVVIVGADVAATCARAGLARRDQVVLVGRDLDDAGVWRSAVDLGADRVVFLPDAEAWLVDLLAASGEGAGRGGLVVGVVGGRGGAGATTLAAALARTGLRLGRATMLVDADPYGGGIDLVLGAEEARGPRWPELAGSRGRVSGQALTEALPRVDELTVLSWDRGEALTIPSTAMTALLSAGARASDLVVVDLPRTPDEAVGAALAAARITLLVVPAEVRAAASAARVAAGVSPLCPDLRVVVRGPAPGGLSPATVAGSLGLPLAGSLRAEPGLAVALERGQAPARRGRGPLADFCAGFLAEVLPGDRRGPAAA